jgi:hypothetical protein
MAKLEWTYNGKEFTSDDCDKFCGYVYLIHNEVNNKKYIGKKFFYFSKTKQVKGKKKRFKVLSDWQDYYGSNSELIEDVKLYGKDKFRREILHLCKSKAECSYLEAREQFDRRVLEKEEFYNAWIMVRVRKANIKNVIDNLEVLM